MYSLQKPGRRPMKHLALCGLMLMAVHGLLPSAFAQQNIDREQSSGNAGTSAEQDTSSAQLRPTAADQTANTLNAVRNRRDSQIVIQRTPYVPNEFERYVQTQASRLNQLSPNNGSANNGPGNTNGEQIRRLGADLLTDLPDGLGNQDPLPQVPDDYIVKPGDEIALTMWGSADANLRLTVDRSGQIAVPRVGTVTVAGTRQAELGNVISRRVAQVFRNFQLSASVSQLRSVRVFVTGFAQRPGSVNVSALSSILHAVMRAGGPGAAGSFRDITLRRGGKVVAKLDLYDLIVRGDRGGDQWVQPDDVVHIGPVGPQVGVIGSVNLPAVVELKSGETLVDAIAMVGGFNAVADRSRVAVERLSDRSTGRVAQVSMLASEGAHSPLGAGDLVRVFSAISAALPQDKQNKRVRVEGEVVRPGDYVLPPNSSLADAVQAAGGFTPDAYLYGTEFTRESVRQAQQQNFDRALRDLETDLAKGASSRRVATTEEVATLATADAANARLVDRLRQVRPTGRVVLQLPPDATALPAMALEDGDRLSIPAKGTSVGVFGSVFNSGSFIYASDKPISHYVDQAGGPTRGADPASMFLIRANGTVVSARQNGERTFEAQIVLPGDTVFVPEETNKTTFVQDAKDWTQILYQFGLGVAGIKSLGL
ncbi:SLBB domain-containing protein [Ideonella azotifigens]|nr:SLBB domain-containing protein [Ideonella azotifigens]MCD2341596.1 SLBB domain-containing protein [Ideonella azotifigens]